MIVRGIMTGALTMTLLHTAGAQIPGREVVLEGASGVELHMEAEGTPAGDAAARLQQTAAQWETQLGAAKPGSKPTTKSGANGTFTVLTAQYDGDPKHVHSFLTSDYDGSICHVRAAVSLSMLRAISSAMRRCAAELKNRPIVSSENSETPSSSASGARTVAPASASGRGPGATASAPPPRGAVDARRSHAEQPPASADQAPLHPENWAGVQEVYFRTAYGSGVGGTLVVKYAPVIFFKDGSSYEIGEAALEDLDLRRERLDRESEWGTWRQNGESFTLSDNRGRQENYKLQDGQLFRAYAAEKGGMLYGKYESVSGGGNSALGGETSILTQRGMTFTRDGRFATKSDTAILGNGNNTGVSIAGGSSRKMAAPGSYKLSRFTLELHFPNGRSERRFFAYSSSGADASISREMIFIGDTSYTTE